MFGPRLSRVFASRNNALWWSAMVLVTAYCVAAEPPGMHGDGTGQETAENIEAKKAGEETADPWADMKAVAQKRGELLP